METTQLVGAYRKLAYPEQLNDYYEFALTQKDVKFMNPPEEWKFHFLLNNECKRISTSNHKVAVERKEKLEDKCRYLMVDEIVVNPLKTVLKGLGDIKISTVQPKQIINPITGLEVNELQNNREDILFHIQNIYGNNSFKSEQRIHARTGNIKYSSRTSSLICDMNERIPEEVVLTPVKLKFVPLENCW